MQDLAALQDASFLARITSKIFARYPSFLARK